MLYVVDNTNLNQYAFNKNCGYHVIPTYGPQGAYLHKFYFVIGGAKFHQIDMMKDRQCVNLQSALFL